MTSITKLIARNVVFPIAIRCGIPRILESGSDRNYLILNYHGVVSKPALALSVNHMGVDQFENHIRYLTKNYNVVSLESIIKMIQSGKKPDKKTIAITFDDGYSNNYNFAFPVLKKYNAPATIFIVSSIVDTRTPTWYDEIDFIKSKLDISLLKKILLLHAELNAEKTSEIKTIGDFKEFFKSLLPTEKKEILDKIKKEHKIDSATKGIPEEFWLPLTSKQINEMTSSGLIEIGSHTVNHPNLDLIPEALAESELKESKKQLEIITGNKISSVAFPDGGYSDKVKTIARAEGYSALLAVNYRCKSDISESDIFQRLSISNTTTFESTALQISLAFSKFGY